MAKKKMGKKTKNQQIAKAEAARVRVLALEKLTAKKKLIVLEVHGGPEPPKEVNSWTELANWFKRLWDDLPPVKK